MGSVQSFTPFVIGAPGRLAEREDARLQRQAGVSPPRDHGERADRQGELTRAWKGSVPARGLNGDEVGAGHGRRTGSGRGRSPLVPSVANQQRAEGRYLGRPHKPLESGSTPERRNVKPPWHCRSAVATRGGDSGLLRSSQRRSVTESRRVQCAAPALAVGAHKFNNLVTRRPHSRPGLSTASVESRPTNPRVSRRVQAVFLRGPHARAN
jgi:hypothetical protein